MRKYSYEKVAAAFKYVADCEKAGKAVYFTKISGLNNNAKQAFKEAITHSFTSVKHGVDLDKIFEFDVKTKTLKRKETPNNPKDGKLILRIMSAMTYVNKHHEPKQTSVRTVAPANPLEGKSEEELLKLQSEINDQLIKIRKPIKDRYDKVSEILIDTIEKHHLYGIPALESWLQQMNDYVTEFKDLKKQHPWLPD